MKIHLHANAEKKRKMVVVVVGGGGGGGVVDYSDTFLLWLCHTMLIPAMIVNYSDIFHLGLSHRLSPDTEATLKCCYALRIVLWGLGLSSSMVTS